MAGERATLMATDPPYLVDYDGGNHPQTWGKRRPGRSARDQKTKHWDAYTDHDSAVAFYADFLRGALAEALGERPGHLPVVRHDARDDRLGGLAGKRPAASPGRDLAQEPPRAGRCDFM